LAEPTSCRLRTRRPVGSMLRALAAADWDTSTLACLAGRWLDGTVLIGWQPSKIVSDGCPEPMPPAGTGRFGAGWIGWLDYAGGGWFGYFDTVLCGDRDGWWLESTGGSVLESTGGSKLDELAGRIDALPEPAAGPVRITDLTGTDRLAHLAAVEQAIIAIRAGELYQANVCARLSGRLAGSPIDLFELGLCRLVPDYAAFIRTPRRTVVSMSPELFLDRRGRQLRTAPIKGTRLRAVAGHRLDDPAAQELQHSDKDRAENVMIVDLMRNDLARVCQPGSVRAEHLLQVRPAPGVWHLVSEVTGLLRPAASEAELLAASFPPGSVTGAPKLRALCLIEELEQHPRGLFTGAIGYLGSASDRSELNVAIRTFELFGDRLELGVGGGITAESVPVAEWQECQVKAAPLLALGEARWPSFTEAEQVPEVVDPAAGVFETMLTVDGRVVALADHLSRLESSCGQLYGLRLPDGLAGTVQAAVAGRTGRVRLTVRPEETSPLIEVGPVGHPAETMALYQHGSRAGSWRHKWADRSWMAQAEDGPALPLYLDCEGAVAETSRGNLAVVLEAGVLRTPALTEAVLPGITRRRLLDAAFDHGWRLEIGRVELADLHRGLLTVHLSSISGLVAVDRLDGRLLGLDRGLLAELRGWLGLPRTGLG
jgi:para-aminobenzoate synthetase/4-amino-4-deoxychorismate lyase